MDVGGAVLSGPCPGSGQRKGYDIADLLGKRCGNGREEFLVLWRGQC